MEVWEVPSSKLVGTSLSEYELGTGGWPAYQERLLLTEQGSLWVWKLDLRPREALDLLQQAAAVLQGQVNCDWGEVGEGLGAGLGY